MITTIAMMLAYGSALAAQPSVEVTSFVYAGQDTRVAELCGVVHDGDKHSHLRVTVDPGTDHPGIYNTIAGADGKFCVVVVTYTGRATAGLMSGTVTSAESQASQARR